MSTLPLGRTYLPIDGNGRGRGDNKFYSLGKTMLFIYRYNDCMYTIMYNMCAEVYLFVYLGQNKQPFFFFTGKKSPL